ncbi:pantetheine-phosphate adenylyltransferase [Lactobacillus hamsteri]|uniref:Phosphopantetheine adenylyltransferase n=1 Tax=Lactobacillus hamsteri DSM 5661 = JCM 6256 TaxID=1423754 RepID=A0A0R1Y4E2_9LACO|nr:pantetheine-phosphate adenylyltransferase [Lactobacillus hamsteri]KRM37191.1 phosphopantetheine adenylyltransferase [Lactobacillus hamsteri DSM 5661 = JCM 6256]
MAIAIFPGSFDPITNGHIDVIEQAAAVFEKIYVVIMTNTHKNYLFSAGERAAFAQDAVKNIKNVTVIEKPDSLTVDVAHELNAKAIVRGVRNSEDFLYEQQIAFLNKKLNDDVKTMLFFTNPENNFVASSMVKEIAKFNGSIEKFLPQKAAEALKNKLGRKD